MGENIRAIEIKKRRLIAKGQIIVGTSEKGGRTRKVWFSPSVSL